MDREEAFRHVGEMNTNHARRRALEAIPHYIWMFKNGKNRVGYCTACGSYFGMEDCPEYVVNDPYADWVEGTGDENFRGPYRFPGKNRDWEHKGSGFCPQCGRRVLYRSIGRGHKSMQDRIFLCLYKKSELDPEHTICMVGYDVIADHRYAELAMSQQYMEEPTAYIENGEPEIKMTPMEICVFRAGGGEEKNGSWRFIRKGFVFGDWDSETCLCKNRRVIWEWHAMRECKSGYRQGGYMWGQGVPTYRSCEDYEDAISGTAFQADRLIMESGNGEFYDRIDRLAMLAKYPAIEYMAKLGWDGLCLEILDGKNERTMNLRGTSPEKVLRCRKEFYGYLKGHGIKPDMGMIRTVQAAEKGKIRISYDTLVKLSGRCRTSAYGDGKGLPKLLNDLKEEYPSVPREKALKYMAKNDIAAQDYMDHLRIMRDLRMDMTGTEFLFPKDFEKTHGELSKRLSVIADREKDRQARERANKLTEYCFSALGYTMRPFITAEEINLEGNTQNICISTYIDRYISGGTILCCVRRDEELYTPFAAVEFSQKTGKMVQCRGKHNRRPGWTEEEESLFWKLFEMARNERKKNRKKKRITEGERMTA